jgi:radical SAM protein with 4Fe4S-binding SPASM domain
VSSINKNKSAVSLFSYLHNAFSIFGNSDIPKDVIFFITSRCNAKCEYCLFRKQVDDKTRGSELSLKEIELIADKYGKIAKLSLSGGEPFLRNDIAEIVRTITQRCGTKIIDIPTNGSLSETIKEKVETILDAHSSIILEIQLSVDGPAEIHNRLRGIDGLFDKTLKTYDLLAEIREKDPRLKIKMNLVYMPENENDIPELVKFFEKRALFDRFQITFPHGENIDQQKMLQMHYDNFFQLSQNILKNVKVKNRREFHSLAFTAIKMIRDEVIHNTEKCRDMGAVCQVGKRIIVLDEVGNVYPCEPLWQSVGNLRDVDYDIKKILYSDKMEEFKKAHWGKGKCHCTWGCVALGKVIHNPIYYPKIIMNMLSLLLHGGRGID